MKNLPALFKHVYAQHNDVEFDFHKTFMHTRK